MTAGKKKVLTEDEAKALLRRYGIQTPLYKIVERPEDLDSVGLEYPLVMKVCSPDILHKTDVGGVMLGIKDAKELAAAYKQMRDKFPGSKVLVERMETGGIEVIVGLLDDPTFGMSIMFGLGGIFAEALRDVTFRVVPITKKDADQMIGELKGSRVFKNFRGMQVDRGALISLLLSVSKLGEDYVGKIDQLDINPVFVRGKECIAIDAKVLFKPSLAGKEGLIQETSSGTAGKEGLIQETSSGTAGKEGLIQETSFTKGRQGPPLDTTPSEEHVPMGAYK